MNYSQIDNNEYEDGRILNDEDFALRLRSHPDIFILHRERRLLIFVLISLLFGCSTGIWLNTLLNAGFNSEFLERNSINRRTDLNVKKYLHYDLQSSAQNEMNTSSKNMDLQDRKEPVHYNPESGVNSQFRTEKHLDSSALTAKHVNRSVVQTQVAQNNALTKEPLITQKTENVINNSESSERPIDLKTIYKMNDHAAAFALLQKALKRNPRDTSALSGMGFMFLSTGLLDSALSYYKSSLAVNPRSSSAHKGLGSVRYYLSTMASNSNYARINKITDTAQYIRSQFDSAMIEYTNAIMLDSSNVDAFCDRAVLSYIHNDYSSAVKDYTLAIKINPLWADAYSKRGAVFKSMGKYREAIDDYTSAIKLDSTTYDFNGSLRFANAYFGRAVLYYKLKKYDLAIRDFDSTIILSPGHSLAILNRAVALLDCKRYEEAIDGFTQAIKALSPVEYDGAQYSAYLQRGNAFKALSQYDKAVEDYKSASGSPKLAGKACWRIAQCFCLEKEDESAIVWLKKSVQNGFADFNKWISDKELARLWGRKEFREIVQN